VLLLELRDDICVGDGVCASWCMFTLGFQVESMCKLVRCSHFVSKLGWSSSRFPKSRCAGRGVVDFLVSVL
jgi:hypothetical protein